MQISNSTQLAHIRQLNKDGKIEEALQIAKNLKEKGDLTTEDNLEYLLLTAILYFRLENYDGAFEIADQAYHEGQKLGKDLQVIDALLIKSLTVFRYRPPFEIKKLEETKGSIAQIEKFLKSLISETLVEINAREGILELVKGYSLLVMGEYDKGLEVYENGLTNIESIEKTDRWSFAIPFFVLRLLDFSRIMAKNLHNFNLYISRLEEGHSYTPIDLLSFNLFKANYLLNKGEFKKALNFCDAGIQMSQELNKQRVKIYLLITKSQILWELFKYDKVEENFSQIDVMLKKLEGNLRVKEMFYIKGRFNSHRGHFFGRLKSELDKGLKLASESLNMFEKVGIPFWKSVVFQNIANLHKARGEFNKAIEYSKKSLAIKEIPDMMKIYNFTYNLGDIYMVKGELDLALENLEKGLELSKKETSKLMKRHQSVSLSRIGWIYWLKGDTEQALRHLERSLNIEVPFYETFFRLIIIHIEIGDLDKAQEYLDNVEERYNRIKIVSQSRFISQVFRIEKALILKATKRIRNRAEAERILREVYEEEITSYKYTIIALVNLCDILLRELENNNDPGILDEIDPLIIDLIRIAKEGHVYSLLAQAYLFQGKLALVQLNLGDSRRFLTQAQIIAEDHDLQLLARSISREHDKLLEQLEEWETFKKRKTPISERMNLVSLGEIIDVMLEKRAIKPLEIIGEEPILLLIMGQDGVPYFNYSFKKNWDFDDVFSAFMSAFNSFSSEVFSDSIDRIKIGDNLILFKSIEPFLLCYVIKGRSYSALQKLNRFSDALKWKTQLWETLNNSIKTGEMLELKKHPSLGEVVNEIFNQ